MLESREWVDIVIAIISVLFAVIGFLMSRRIDTQDKDIQQLYELHRTDEKDLNILGMKIAENYPIKNDLRVMTQDLKDYFDERFKVVEQLAKNGIGRGDR